MVHASSGIQFRKERSKFVRLSAIVSLNFPGARFQAPRMRIARQNGDEDLFSKRLEEREERTDQLVEEVCRIVGAKCPKPSGGGFRLSE